MGARQINDRAELHLSTETWHQCFLLFLSFHLAQAEGLHPLSQTTSAYSSGITERLDVLLLGIHNSHFVSFLTKDSLETRAGYHIQGPQSISALEDEHPIPK